MELYFRITFAFQRQHECVSLWSVTLKIFDSLYIYLATHQQTRDVELMPGNLPLVLLNCFNYIFLHLNLELLTQFPAPNDKNIFIFLKIHFLNLVILLAGHLSQTILSVSVTYYLP